MKLSKVMARSSDKKVVNKVAIIIYTVEICLYSIAL